MTDEAWTEELTQPRPRRSGRVLLVLLVLSAAGAVAVRLSGSDAGDARTASTAVPTAVPTTPPATSAPDAPELEFVPPAGCPRATDGQVACTTYKIIPAGVRHAVRTFDRTIVIDAAITQMLRSTGPYTVRALWSRQITAHAGPLRLRIAVSRRDTADPAADGYVGTIVQVSGGYALARRGRGHYSVQIEVRGASVDSYRLVSKLGWLVTDRRLVRAVAPGGTMVG
jgi:hypothetical protein